MLSVESVLVPPFTPDPVDQWFLSFFMVSLARGISVLLISKNYLLVSFIFYTFVFCHWFLLRSLLLLLIVGFICSFFPLSFSVFYIRWLVFNLYAWGFVHNLGFIFCPLLSALPTILWSMRSLTLTGGNSNYPWPLWVPSIVLFKLLQQLLPQLPGIPSQVNWRVKGSRLQTLWSSLSLSVLLSPLTYSTLHPPASWRWEMGKARVTIS